MIETDCVVSILFRNLLHLFLVITLYALFNIIIES
jgi:hypothetical protein